MIIYICDLVGTFAFAFVGAQLALRHRLNFLGIVVLASTMAVGGGTIRELLIHQTPFYFYNYTYLIMILSATLCALSMQTPAVKARGFMTALDALGTITFALNGALAALGAGLGLSATILFAGLTAFGGGIICDIIIRQTPHVFRSAVCTVPSLTLGGICWLARGEIANPAIAIGLVTTMFVVQLSIVRRTYFIRAWRKTFGWQLKLKREVAAQEYNSVSFDDGT